MSCGVTVRRLHFRVRQYAHATAATTTNQNNRGATVTGLIWGLLGALLIGASDCTARVTSQKVSLLPLIFCVMAISTIILTVALLATDSLPVWHTRAWFVSALSGVLNIAALLFLYKALAYGPVSVASPAASSFAVFLVLLNALAGEPWTVYQAFSVVMVFVGVVMLSVKSDTQKSANTNPDHQYSKKWLRRTSLLATGAAITIAFRMFFAQEATAELGAVSALYLNRLFALISCGIALIVAPLLIRSRGKPSTPNQWPRNGIKWFVLLQGLLEMAAFAAFLYGSEGEGRVAATIGFSTFAAATTLIAWLALKEPIGWWRAVWIAFISIGVIIASIG